jgi:hypothetical protein
MRATITPIKAVMAEVAAEAAVMVMAAVVAAEVADQAISQAVTAPVSRLRPVLWSKRRPNNLARNRPLSLARIGVARQHINLRGARVIGSMRINEKLRVALI